jgi:hypothetical protein
MHAMDLQGKKKKRANCGEFSCSLIEQLSQQELRDKERAQSQLAPQLLL